MLEEVRIRGLGVVADAVLELHPGLTVLTGETGAGKTMVVQGLTLLLGGRLDSGLVAGDRAVVEGRIALPPDSPALARALDAGADLDDGALLVSRSMTADGRSRCHLGGRSVPVSVVAEIADALVARHGQHDQQRLLRPAEQRAALDRYADLGADLAAYRAAWARHREVAARLDEVTAARAERAREAELLRHGLAEIEKVAPAEGEAEELAAEVARLAHADALREAATTAHDALAGDPAGDGADATGLVGAARRALERAAGHDESLDALGRRLAEASYLLADVAAELAGYAASVEADPLRLEQAQQRQAALAALARRYGDPLAWARDAAPRLAELDSDDDTVAALAAERDALLAELRDRAAALHERRVKAADELGRAVSVELADLAMPDAAVTAAVTGTELGPDGADAVELLLAPHPGAPARPLGRGASGGELSRVMLAVEVVFAGADPVPTMVFDEVDAGVGGKAAVEVGRRLARLARTHQVVVVTHLPQVAAFADRHLRVVKGGDGSVTRTDVTVLDDDARLRELSRMLAGLEDSALARGHAEELLAAAASAKTP